MSMHGNRSNQEHRLTKWNTCLCCTSTKEYPEHKEHQMINTTIQKRAIHWQTGSGKTRNLEHSWGGIPYSPSIAWHTCKSLVAVLMRWSFLWKCMDKLERIQRSPESKYRQRSKNCVRKDQKLGSFNQEETGRQHNISEKEESKKFFSVFTRNGVGNDGFILQQSFNHKEN